MYLCTHDSPNINQERMTSLQERLFAMQDKQYAAFQAKLTPGVPMERFIGIRVPVLRKFAKEFTKEAECDEFLHNPKPFKFLNFLGAKILTLSIFLYTSNSEKITHFMCLNAIHRHVKYVTNDG